MKKRLILGVFALLLLLAGCRSLKDNSSTGNDAVPTVSASTVSIAPSGIAAPFGGDAGITPASQSSRVPVDSVTPASTQNTASTPPVTPPPVSAAPAASAAPKSEVSATLDDIIKELNDLDKLYSQMDNLTESDLN